jgi:hypothetical protein
MKENVKICEHLIFFHFTSYALRSMYVLFSSIANGGKGGILMWLEELVWFWGPAVGGIGLWGVWNLIFLKTEVKMLRDRVAQLESKNERRCSATQKAA